MEDLRNDSAGGGGGNFSLPFTYSARGNGRVNLSATDGVLATNPLPGFGYQNTSEVNFQSDMMRGNWEVSELSDSFFSKANVTLIQNGIRRYVFDRSQPKGYIIDDQSVDELKIIMRAMFYQYAKNLPHDIPGQVDELNRRVIAWSGPHILSAVDHYVYYLKDIDTMPVPLAHPALLSRAGSKTLPLQPYM